MPSPADMAERHSAILAELAELGLALARDLQGRALAADDGAVADLALAFHRVSRSVRQSMALEARLVRERAAGEREAAELALREGVRRLQQRRGQVRAAVARLIWDEAEGEDEALALLADLDERLAEETLSDDFTAEALDAHITRIRADLLGAVRLAAVGVAASDDAGEVAAAPPYEYDAAYDGAAASPLPPAGADPDPRGVVHRVAAWTGPPDRPAPPDRQSSA